ncbi:MAG: histidine kinase [Acidimicrobiales bacterium]
MLRNGSAISADEPTPGRALRIDIAIAVGCLIFAVVAMRFDFGEGDVTANTASYVLAPFACIALIGRRYSSLAVLLVIAAIHLVLAGSVGAEVGLAPTLAVAIYTVARYGPRRRSLVIAVIIGTVLAAGQAALNSDFFPHEFLGEWGANLFPVAVADAVRSRADRVQMLIDTEADKRVQAERLRIARDLHDVVAHGLSTIAVQSGVAAHLLDRNPDQAKEALQIINATGKSSLEELRTMVGVLRSPDQAPLRPTPADPNDLAAVIDGAANAGVIVTTNVSGAFPDNATESCIVAMHRIIQEALTNVARHAGSVPTEVWIEHGRDEVEIRVTNEPSDRSAVAGNRSTGVGIVGMTERAETLGGTLTAMPTADGGFEVRSTLPYHPRRLDSAREAAGQRREQP